MRRAAAALAATLGALLPWSAPACDLEQPSGTPPCTRTVVDRLPLAAVQAVGTHNSYKLAMPPDELAAHRAVEARGAEDLDYAHPALPTQLERGVRVLELDVYYDPTGGRYLAPPGAHRRGYAQPPWSPDDLALMRAPGFKVMHLHDVDFRSSCVTLVQCLGQVRQWSLAHPWHAPIMISVNAKDGAGGPRATPALPFDAAAFDALDGEIRAVFDDRQLFEPRHLRGGAQSLREAVRTRGWPTLGAMRGRVLFVLDEEADKRATYLQRGGEPAMFVAVGEHDDNAALLVLNDPILQAARIQAAVKAGFLVRTRADADTREARAGDLGRRDAAFASGAQFVSTDYPTADPRWPGYRVVFPHGGYLRCHPSHPACMALSEP